MLLRIGEFSRLSQVSIRSLRHYDQIGLLKPLRIDSENHYRYYSLDQLPRINQIIALRKLDFSLEQIRSILETQGNEDDLRTILHHHRNQLLTNIREQITQLIQVEQQLENLDRDGTLPLYNIVIKPLPEIPVMSIRRRLDPKEGNLSGLFYRMGEKLAQQGVEVDLTIGIFHGHPFFNGKDWEYEWLAVLPDPDISLPPILVDERHTMTPAILPDIERAASIFLEGSFTHKTVAERHFLAWAERNGYRLSGPIRELYLRVMDGNPMHEENLMELQFPIAKA